MFSQNYGIGVGAPAWIPAFGPMLVLLVLWSIFWKGLALWHSGRRGEPWWFVILLVVNTAGILEIVYLFFVARLKQSELFGKK
jgi:hypothetical protein